MVVKTLKFSFDYCDSCLWDEGGLVELDSLPLSDSMKKDLYEISEEFSGILNWSDPHEPSPWTRKQCVDFFDRAEIICRRLQAEFKGSYEVINCLEYDRRMYLYDNVFSDD